MKKQIILAAILSLVVLRSTAQGVINADNVGQNVRITISDDDGIIAGGAPIVIGTPATAAGFTGAGPGQVTLSLFAAPAGSSLVALLSSTPIWTGLNSPSTGALFQGTVAPGGIFTLPTESGFSGNGIVEFVFVGAADVLGQLASGFSSIGEIQPITASEAASGTPPPHIWGTTDGDGITFMDLDINSPEPSTVAIGGLGAVAWIFFRRRK